MVNKEDDAEIHLGKIEARAGSRTKVNRTALVGGLLLVLVAFAVILGFGFRQTERTGADQVSGDNVAANESAH